VHERFQGILTELQFVLHDDIVSGSGGSLQAFVCLEEEVPEAMRGNTTIDDCAGHRVATSLVHVLVVGGIEPRVMPLTDNDYCHL
jgi:hypothetical protein